MTSQDQTHLQVLIDRYLANDASAFDDLIAYADKRLRALARKMLTRYPHVRRWEETDDVMQAALVRLHRSLSEVRPDTKRAFFGLAATQMRRTLIDLARHYYGARGIGKHHRSVVADGGTDSQQQNDPFNRVADSGGPDDLDRWAAFHCAIEELPDEEQEVLSLVWYGGLKQKEVAEVLRVSERTVIRRMNRAKLALHELIGDQFPGG